MQNINSNQISFLKQLIDKNQFSEAHHQINKFIESKNMNPDVINLKGVLFKKQKKYKIAKKYFMLNIKNYPLDPSCNFNLANLFAETNQFDKAIYYYKRTEKYGTSKLVFSALNNLGVIFKKKKDFNKALQYFNKARINQPNVWYTYNNIADVYFEIENYKKALNFYEESEKKNPNLCMNKANTLRYLGKYNESRKLLEKILSTKKNDFLVAYNLANVYLELGFFKKSIEMLKRSILLKPNFFDALYCLSRINFLLNKQNEFAKFHHYRCHLREHFKTKILEDKKSKYKFEDAIQSESNKIIFYAEQGIGDEIFFASLINSFTKEYENEVAICCSNRLKNIFKLSFPNILIIDENDLKNKKNVNSYEIQLPIGSLLENFKPKKMPKNFGKQYLFSNAELNLKWKKQLRFDNSYKIGISWSGGATKFQQSKRTLPLKMFLDVFSKNVCLINLQYGSERFKLKKYQQTFKRNIIDFVDIESSDNFDDYFSLISQLDLVITCDNSVAHIAGSLGIKTYLLLNKIPDFRWGIKSNKTPFYQSIEIIRQIKNNSWKEPLKILKEKINTLIKN